MTLELRLTNVSGSPAVTFSLLSPSTSTSTEENQAPSDSPPANSPNSSGVLAKPISSSSSAASKAKSTLNPPTSSQPEISGLSPPSTKTGKFGTTKNPTNVFFYRFRQNGVLQLETRKNRVHDFLSHLQQGPFLPRRAARSRKYQQKNASFLQVKMPHSQLVQLSRLQRWPIHFQLRRRYLQRRMRNLPTQCSLMDVLSYFTEQILT